MDKQHASALLQLIAELYIIIQAPDSIEPETNGKVHQPEKVVSAKPL